jgi:antitoxin PrlF
MYLVDTNVISEARKGERANASVRAFFAKASEQDWPLFLSVISIGELQRGVNLIRHRGDDGLNRWLQQRALANQGSTGVDTNLVTSSRVTSSRRSSMARRGPGSPPNGLTWCKTSRAAPLVMAVSPYRVTPARIGNSSGLRLPAVIYRDHPQFAGVAGQAEVLDDRTLLLRFEPEAQQQDKAVEDSLILGLFLDFLSRQALTADPGPLIYSEAMAVDDEELLAGVTDDAADVPPGA